MPLLPARKNRLPLKHESVTAFLATAVLVVGALCFTFFVGTKLHQLSCRLGEPTDEQLLADILQKLTLLGQRFNHPGSARTFSAGDAGAPGGATEPDFRGTYLGSAARSSIPALDDRIKVTIPMQIWQTVRSFESNSLATATLFNSWTNINPQWDHFLFDEAEMHDFVKQHFEEDVVELFQAMPLNHMRVDVFRFMVLVHHGGVFANLDTLCMWPVPAWVPRGCHFAAAVDRGAPGTLSPALVAAVAGDGVVEAVLLLMLERMRGVKALLAGGAAPADIAFNTTGAGAFSDAVVMHAGAISEAPIKDVAGLLQARAGLRSKKVCLLTAAEMAQYAVQAELAWEWDRGLEWDSDST